MPTEWDEWLDDSLHEEDNTGAANHDSGFQITLTGNWNDNNLPFRLSK